MDIKRCFKCGEVKSLSDFYRHAIMAVPQRENDMGFEEMKSDRLVTYDSKYCKWSVTHKTMSLLASGKLDTEDLVEIVIACKEANKEKLT